VRVGRRGGEPGGRAAAAIDARAGCAGDPPRVGEVVLGWSDQEEPMALFVNAQVPEVVLPFWDALQRGEFIADAAVAVGTYRKQGVKRETVVRHSAT
jgi:hypothetical protein